MPPVPREGPYLSVSFAVLCPFLPVSVSARTYDRVGVIRVRVRVRVRVRIRVRVRVRVRVKVRVGVRVRV